MKTLKLILTFYLIIWILNYCLEIELQAAELTLTKIEQDPVGDVAEAVLEEAYQELSIKLKILFAPAKRALVISNSGEADGELNRIKGINKKFKNLIMIPVPINQLEGVVYTKKKHIFGQRMGKS